MKRKLILATVFAVILMFINKPPVYADEDTYTVKYITYGSGVSIDAKTCGWNDADLGYGGREHPPFGWKNVEEEFQEKGEDFQGWYIDESFETKYDNQTYASLAGHDREVKQVKLYAKLGHKHDGVSYAPWGITNRMPDKGGNYYLLHNVVLDDYNRYDEAAWTVPGDVNLCLNGHTITRKEKNKSNQDIPCPVISVPQGILLQIKDCKRGHDDAGSIQGGDAEYGGGILVKGNLDLHDAVITGNKAASVGGGIAVMGNGSCSLTKCEIKGNSVDTNGHGGGVYIADTAVLALCPENEAFVTVQNNKAGNEASDVSIQGDGSDRPISVGKMTERSRVGISVRGEPQLFADPVTVARAFNANSNITGLFCNDKRFQIEMQGAGADQKAVLKYKMCQVTFMSDNEVFHTATVYGGQEVSRPQENPTRDGSEFAAWMLGNDPYDFSTRVYEDITLHARFDSDHYHDGKVFTSWTSANSLPTKPGNYCLTTDVTLEDEYSLYDGKVSLCLNGHTIRKKKRRKDAVYFRG